MNEMTHANPAPMPPVKGGLVPYLMVDGAIKAAEFYKRAFAAEEAGIAPPMSRGERCMFISTSTAVRS